MENSKGFVSLFLKSHIMTKLTLGFSPCPNDTFIFDALVHKKVDTAGLEFEIVFADVEQLNKWALQGKLDVTKLSHKYLTYV